MTDAKLDCLRCPSLCCRQAGYVEVSRADIRRLAKFLGLSVPAFERAHIVARPRKGRPRIKAGYETCQFLGEDRMCTVYPARPRDCGGYYCWEQQDTTVYEFARFLQTAPATLRGVEAAEADPPASD